MKKSDCIEQDILLDARTDVLQVKTKTIVEKSEIDKEGFIEKIEEFLSNSEHIWRSSEKISTHFNVDPVELDKFLSNHEKITSKSNDDKVFYALKSRLEQKVEKPRIIITEEDRYCLAQASLAVDIISQVLKRFAMNIHNKCPAAFSNLVEGKSKLEIGLVHLAAATKANLEKLE